MPRQSAALKVLRGNPGQRPILPDVTPAPPLDPEPPLELGTNAVARAEWYRVVPTLIECRQVTVTDRAVVIAYCLAWAQWRALDLQAAREPFVIERAAGSVMPNPLVGMAREALTQLVKLSTELGLTPASRAKVSASTAPAALATSAPVGKWGALLK